jgi:hypothetical protein
MAPKRREYPSLRFFHFGHEFLISAVPDGANVELHIADQYGQLLLPLSLMILGAKVRRGGDNDRRRIAAGMAEVRKLIEALDEARLLKLLEVPRAASNFDWTPEELDAASKIDWSHPAATLVHEDRSFSIAAFETEQRMVFLLGDADGPFDGPMSIPREMIMRAELKGDDPLLFGVRAMVTQIRTWSTSRTTAFVRNGPRLMERMRPTGRPTSRNGRS